MAGRRARSDRGNVRGALVDEFTHVITCGTTRNCVLKQSSTLLGRCSALCRRLEAALVEAITGKGPRRERRGADGDGRDGDMTTRGLRRSTSAAAAVGPGC